MAKIMLVEDDNNLREIYEARLLAEGYEIVSAKDGEEALALAVKEKPDLIISDVMMPKISGFDMLDILRSTPETKNTKVIMMTALSQAEDKSRADKLGADRYLVKSQVTLEDVAKVAHDILTGETDATPTQEPLTESTPAQVPQEPASVATSVPDQPVTPIQDTSVPTTVVATQDPVTSAPDEPAAVTPLEPTTSPEPVVNSITQTPPPADQVETPASSPVTTIPVISDNEPDTKETEQAGPTPPETLPEPATTTVGIPVESPDTETQAATSIGISDTLTQTTADEADAAESQINEILAQSEPTQVVEEVATAVEASIEDTPEEVNQGLPTEPTASNNTETIEVASAPLDDSTLPEAPVTPQVISSTPIPVSSEPIIMDSTPSVPPVPVEEPVEIPEPTQESEPVTGAKKIIRPIGTTTAPDLKELLKLEEAKEAALSGSVSPAQAPEPAVPPSSPPTDKPAAPPSTDGISPNDISL